MATSPPTDRRKLRMVTAIALVTLTVTSSVAYGGGGCLTLAPDAVPRHAGFGSSSARVVSAVKTTPQPSQRPRRRHTWRKASSPDFRRRMS